MAARRSSTLLTIRNLFTRYLVVLLPLVAVRLMS
jgi:hypothetical protein